MTSAIVQLPRGAWLHGERHPDADVRALTGEDEVALSEPAWATTATARRATALLGRCVERIGPIAPVTAETLRALSVGDREALLLHVRRLTFGDRAACVIVCPLDACGEKMDVDLRVSDLLLAPYVDARERHDLLVGGDADGSADAYRVRFRVPTGGDQELAADVAARGVDAAVHLLLRRCVETVERVADDERVEIVPAAVARALPAEMARLDPQAEILLDLACPECGHRFQSLFDAGGFLLQEVHGRAGGLYREVHVLAYHYHWSASEILGMTPRRRRLFLEMLYDALSEAGA